MPSPTADLSALFDAYGPATGASGHLEALRTGDDDARVAAVRYLWSAVLHQGTPSTVTPGVVRELCAVIGRSDVPAELRVELLAFLAEVAEEGTQPWVGRAELEAALAAAPDVAEEQRALHEAGREEELYDDPDLTGALLGLAALGCRDVQVDVLPVAVRLLEDADGDVRPAAARVVRAAHGVLSADDATAEQRAAAERFAADVPPA